jgi:hypothetical protein
MAAMVARTRQPVPARYGGAFRYQVSGITDETKPLVRSSHSIAQACGVAAVFGAVMGAGAAR